MKLRNYFACAFAATTMLASSAVAAKEVVLRAVMAFQPGSIVSEPFERFVKKVNEEGKGLVQINR